MDTLMVLIDTFERAVLDLAAERARGNSGDWEYRQVDRARARIIDHVERMVTEAQEAARA